MAAEASPALRVTGRGVISSLGEDVATLAAAVFAGCSGIGPLDGAPPRLRFVNGAPVRDFRPADHFSSRDLGLLDRFSLFATVAARRAWAEAAIDPAAIDADRVAVIVGSANAGIDVLEEGYGRLFVDGGAPRPMTIPQTMGSAPASRIAREIGARGPVFGVSSACASAAHAIVVGAALLRSGLVDVAVVGGADSCFAPGFLRAWDSLRVVSPDTCRPFSRDRNGLILGEGAGILVLEAPDFAARRGATVVADLLGGGMASDAGDLLAPDPAGMERAMRLALAAAGVSADAVGYVNAHGTGTGANDRAEAAALRTVFGGRAEPIPVSSTKSMIGHALGAAGAIEAIVTIAALEAGLLPPTLNFLGVDPEVGIEPIPDVARPAAIDVALSNSFAFGGLDVSLAFGRAGRG